MSNLPSHLGGQVYGNVDLELVKYLKEKFKIESLIDIGCGDGMAAQCTALRSRCVCAQIAIARAQPPHLAPPLTFGRSTEEQEHRVCLTQLTLLAPTHAPYLSRHGACRTLILATR